MPVCDGLFLFSAATHTIDAVREREVRNTGLIVKHVIVNHFHLRRVDDLT